jgi:Ca-activated chloride channel family protein
MSGTPIRLVKEAMAHSIKNLNPKDTFNIYLFSSDLKSLSEDPLLATDKNLEKALDYIDDIDAGGGTEVMPAIEKAINSSLTEGRLRIVSAMSDGQVANDDRVLEEIQESNNEEIRFFPFSIGSAPNRYLLDRMAEVGRGKSFYVGNNDDPEKAVDKFYSRIDSPVFTDLDLDFGGQEVYDVFPSQLPDLFIGEPVYVSGRYKNSGEFDVTLSGTMGAIEKGSSGLWDETKESVGMEDDSFPTKEEEIKISPDFPSHSTEELGISSVWARSKVKDLMNEYRISDKSESVKRDIIDVGIKYNLMTNFTSFVAVEEKVVNEDGDSKRTEVPVELPEGTEREGYFGKEKESLSSTGKSGGMHKDFGQNYAENTSLGGRSRDIEKSLMNLIASSAGFIGLLLLLISTILYWVRKLKYGSSGIPKKTIIAGASLFILSLLIFLLIG